MAINEGWSMTPDQWSTSSDYTHRIGVPYSEQKGTQKTKVQ